MRSTKITVLLDVVLSSSQISLLADVSEKITAFFTRTIMQAVSTSETSINVHRTTLRNIPDGSHINL
jgi:hypothetical protein